MRWLLFGLLSVVVFRSADANATSPLMADQCLLVTLQSSGLSEADRIFLTEQQGGTLRLCRNAQSASVTDNAYISAVERLPVGLCRYFIGRLYDTQTGDQHHWSLTPASASMRDFRFQYQYLSNGAICPPPVHQLDKPYYINDSLYTRVGPMADELYVAFMRYWFDMLSSPQAFDRRLTAAQREAVLKRGKETLWLLAGCIAARADGCSIRIEQLDVTSQAQDLIRAQFQIDGFSRIESVFDGMIVYRPGQQRYQGVIGIRRTEAGFELVN